jgi:hypothetical protein
LITRPFTDFPFRIADEPTRIAWCDRRNIAGSLAELPRKQTVKRTAMLATRFRCKSLHILHVLIETTQFLIHGRCCQHPFRDHGMGSQDHEEMAECGPKIFAPVHDRSRTSAMRQVFVEKPCDDVLVKMFRVQSALAHPPANAVSGQLTASSPGAARECVLWRSTRARKR